MASGCGRMRGSNSYQQPSTVSGEAQMGWTHPLRALNAMIVRVLGTNPVTIRIDLDPPPPSARHSLMHHARLLVPVHR
jgi:hypothetical protein